jgi:hypothetical protein
MTGSRGDGIIYIFTNQDNTACKVGFTQADTPAKRLDSYSREHCIQCRFYWSARTRQVRSVESRIHGLVDLWRHSFAPGAEEIFGLPPHKMKKYCELCLIPVPGDQTPIPDPVDGIATLEALVGEWQRFARNQESVAQLSLQQEAKKRELLTAICADVNTMGPMVDDIAAKVKT